MKFYPKVFKFVTWPVLPFLRWNHHGDPEVVTKHSAQTNAVEHKLLTQTNGEDGQE